ncbi:MAG: D-aminoacyl-tRNA deacylase, partial [Firmicutes bacterium]|nr:D-aminoacyl-tRNA deacylase [Bacillota bacterium]
LNKSVKDLGYEVLFVSNFTLYGDCRHGRRPSYSTAAPVEAARDMFERFKELASQSQMRSSFGVFQADMEIHQVCSGPVTLLLDSGKAF